MRLTKQQTDIITQTVTRLAGIGAAVYLFGSRLNDQAKGGDIDLFIESDTSLSLIHRAQIKMELDHNLAYPLTSFRNPVVLVRHLFKSSLNLSRLNWRCE